MAELVRQAFVYIATHRAIQLVVVPCVLALGLGYVVPGAHTPSLLRLWSHGETVVFWTGLGILSSVGLGTGMHSGVLFLFPHIARVCMAASACGSVDNFDENFACLSEPPQGAQVTFVQLFCAVFWPCFLWGSGTAIGEIPPYAIARAARLAGDQADDLAEWSSAASPDASASLQARFVSWMKVWMFASLDRYGFWAILAFSAWPNMAFDLCGLACGHFLISFWVFFGAVFIGKALIKVNMQAMFFITLFQEQYVDTVAKWLDRLLPVSWGLEAYVRALFSKQRARFMSGKPAEPAAASLPAQLWSVVLFAFIGSFAVSVVHSLAQQRQRSLDDAAIDAAIAARAADSDWARVAD